MDPSPKQRRRHDGWTLERQARFLATLEATGCVSTAAAAAGKSRAGAYQFRDRGDGARFGRLVGACAAAARRTAAGGEVDSRRGIKTAEWRRDASLSPP